MGAKKIVGRDFPDADLAEFATPSPKKTGATKRAAEELNQLFLEREENMLTVACEAAGISRLRNKVLRALKMLRTEHPQTNLDSLLLLGYLRKALNNQLGRKETQHFMTYLRDLLEAKYYIEHHMGRFSALRVGL